MIITVYKRFIDILSCSVAPSINIKQAHLLCKKSVIRSCNDQREDSKPRTLDERTAVRSSSFYGCVYKRFRELATGLSATLLVDAAFSKLVRSEGLCIKWGKKCIGSVRGRDRRRNSLSLTRLRAEDNVECCTSRVTARARNVRRV